MGCNFADHGENAQRGAANQGCGNRTNTPASPTRNGDGARQGRLATGVRLESVTERAASEPSRRVPLGGTKCSNASTQTGSRCATCTRVCDTCARRAEAEREQWMQRMERRIEQTITRIVVDMRRKEKLHDSSNIQEVRQMVSGVEDEEEIIAVYSDDDDSMEMARNASAATSSYPTLDVTKLTESDERSGNTTRSRLQESVQLSQTLPEERRPTGRRKVGVSRAACVQGDRPKKFAQMQPAESRVKIGASQLVSQKPAGLANKEAVEKT